MRSSQTSMLVHQWHPGQAGTLHCGKAGAAGTWSRLTLQTALHASPGSPVVTAGPACCRALTICRLWEISIHDLQLVLDTQPYVRDLLVSAISGQSCLVEPLARASLSPSTPACITSLQATCLPALGQLRLQAAPQAPPECVCPLTAAQTAQALVHPSRLRCWRRPPSIA